MNSKKTLALAVAGALMLAPTAFAQSDDGWQDGRFAVTLGGAHLSPTSSSGSLADGAFDASIDGGNAVTLGLSWFFNDNFAVELWGTPDKFNHTVSLNGAPGAEIAHRPVALSAQYHFTFSDQFRPFVGLGYHHTNVFNERGVGPLDGARVGVETGEGVIGTVGVDFLTGRNWFVRTEARYLDWRSDVGVEGASVGRVDVDPWLVGLSVGARF